MKLIPNCPACAAFAEHRDPHAGKVTVVRMVDGGTHAIPSMWLAGAMFGPLKLSVQDALARWVWHCGIEIAAGRAT